MALRDAFPATTTRRMQRPRSPLLKYFLVAALTAVVVGGVLTAVLWRRTAGGVASAIWRRIAERRPEATVLDLKTRPDMARFAYDRSVHEFSRTPPVDQAVNDPESPAHAVRRGLEVKVHSVGYTYPVNIAFAPEPETPSADAPFYYVAELHGTIQYATRGAHQAASRYCTHAHPSRVIAKKGYAKKGSGWDKGVSEYPAKICNATVVNNSAPMYPMPLTHRGMTPDAPTSTSEAAHKATPAPNEGALSTRSMAALERISASPTTKIRNPAAARSLPLRK